MSIRVEILSDRNVKFLDKLAEEKTRRYTIENILDGLENDGFYLIKEDVTPEMIDAIDAKLKNILRRKGDNGG